MKKKTNTLNLTVRGDKSLTAPGHRRVVEIAIKAPTSDRVIERPPLNLAIVIDRSGSMSSGKLEYVKQAAIFLLDNLNEKDRIAVVTYDDEITIIEPGCQANPAAVAVLRQRIRQLEPGGSTNLGGGWTAGCQCVAHGMLSEGVNRVLLLTDGLANVGITDTETLGTHARELQSRNVSTTTFGVGRDFNEHLLEHMANMGSGNFYYIESPTQIPAFFAQEFKELSTITARRVTIDVGLLDHVKCFIPGGWKVEKIDERLQVSLGDLPSGCTREIYLYLQFNERWDASEATIKIGAHALDNEQIAIDDQAEIKFQRAEPTEVDAAPQDKELMERFSQVYIHDRSSDALHLDRQGRFDEARAMMLDRDVQELRGFMPMAAQADLDMLINEGIEHMTPEEAKEQRMRMYRSKQRRQP